jgi:hypothetical protein
MSAELKLDTVSIRAQNVLGYLRLKTVSDLREFYLRRGRLGLLTVPGCGRRTVTEIVGLINIHDPYSPVTEEEYEYAKSVVEAYEIQTRRPNLAPSAQLPTAQGSPARQRGS